MAAKETRRSVDLAEIRALAKVLQQFDLAELELEHGGMRVRLRRERAGGGPAPLAASPGVGPVTVAAHPPASPAARPEPADDGSVQIHSPFVGTFYRAPSPEAPPFVEVGQTVKRGQVLCIVEAMKLMNEIEAEVDCKIVEVLAKNAEPVEFGQPLYRVLPLP